MREERLLLAEIIDSESQVVQVCFMTSDHDHRHSHHSLALTLLKHIGVVVWQIEGLTKRLQRTFVNHYQ